MRLTACTCPFRTGNAICAIFLAVAFTVPTINAATSVDLDITSLQHQHPRLLVSEEDFSDLRDREWDAPGTRLWAFIEDSGVRMLDVPPVTRELIGMRLLGQSHKALKIRSFATGQSGKSRPPWPSATGTLPTFLMSAKWRSQWPLAVTGSGRN